MKYIIGIDGGGTKTLGYIGNLEGKILTSAISGPANYHSVGIEKVQNSLNEVIHNLLKKVDGNKKELALLSLGLAGVDRENDKQVIRRIISNLNLDCEVLLNNDAKTSLVGAHGTERGVIVVSGTGSICYGIDSNGKVERAGGWGHMVDDEGSGYDIGRIALKALFKAHDGRGKETILTEKILKFLKLNNIEELLQYIYKVSTTKNDIASIAPIVFEGTSENDEVSLEIIDQAVNSLIAMTKAVINKLDFKDENINIALSGGIFTNVNMLREKFIREITKRNDKINVYKPLFNGAVGAMILGFNYLNVNYNINQLRMKEGELDG